MNLDRGLATSGLANASARVAAVAFTGIAGVVIARELGAAGRGAYALFVTSVDLSRVLLGLGLHEAVAVAAAHGGQSSPDLKRFSGSVAFLAALACTLVSIVAYVGDIVHAPTIALLLFAIAVPGVIFSQLQEGALKGRGDFTGYQRMLLAQSLVFLVATATGVIIIPSSLMASVAYVASAWASAWFATRRLTGRDVGSDRWDRWRLVRFGMAVWPGSIMAFASRRLDFLILGMFAGGASVGVYAVATQIAELLLLLPGGFAAAVTSQAAQERFGRRELRRLSFAVCILLVSASLIVLAVAHNAIPWVFGAEFGASWRILAVLLPGIVALGLSSVLSACLSSKGFPLGNTLSAGVGLVIASLGYVTLIPQFGAVGAAGASSIGYSAQLACQLIAVRKIKRFAEDTNNSGAASLEGFSLSQG